MKRPDTITKEFLKQCHDKGSYGVGISRVNENPNALLKKYSYWVYHYNMPYQSAIEVFWKEEHKLSMKQYLDLRKSLIKSGTPFAMVQASQYRLGTNIWNYEKILREYPETSFAVSYADDTDDVCKEMYNHK